MRESNHTINIKTIQKPLTRTLSLVWLIHFTPQYNSNKRRDKQKVLDTIARCDEENKDFKKAASVRLLL